MCIVSCLCYGHKKPTFVISSHSSRKMAQVKPKFSNVWKLRFKKFVEFYFKFEKLWSAKGLLPSYTSFNYPNRVMSSCVT